MFGLRLVLNILGCLSHPHTYHFDLIWSFLTYFGVFKKFANYGLKTENWLWYPSYSDSAPSNYIKNTDFYPKMPGEVPFSDFWPDYICYFWCVYMPALGSVDDLGSALDELAEVVERRDPDANLCIMGDFNGDVGTSCGERGVRPPTRRVC